MTQVPERITIARFAKTALPGTQESIMAINRTRRSSIERRCVSKTAKRLFRGKGRTMFKVIYAAECHARNRKGLG